MYKVKYEYTEIAISQSYPRKNVKQMNMTQIDDRVKQKSTSKKKKKKKNNNMTLLLKLN